MTGSQYIAAHALIPGDTIVARFKEKLGGLVGLNHFVVYLGGDKAIHNMPDEGVNMISMDKVAEDYEEIERIERFQGSPSQLSKLLHRAKRSIGRKYDLIKFNCESLANYLRFGSPFSRQVTNCIIGTILSVVIIYVVVSAIFKRK